ncbi:uncharacterized protein F5Z01DRAFT_670442 [Emericellopsis atlantica]|uniref:Uncharacterized protein n=1 Tax=Emericellopsis atlantica TaxID=2614577 RepID=A0A9P8CWV0_9HYPO|nr:uncharacterized protein F5Z01DRAFT_670442 [Emericellopsis atlantica]KAG9258736.1 hypothetical protein F5Z01DRAFT_670442 [Emericellopsis atlantica]
MAHHQRHHPGGSYPPPLFVAELDGSIPHTSPDGAPVFEMPAEPSPNSQVDSHSQPKKSERQNSDTPAQANPWAYFGPSDDSASVVTPTPTNRPPAERHDSASNSAAATATQTEQGGRQGHAGYGSETMVPTMTGESSISATDYPSNLRPETVSPVSPSAGPSAYFPPPLNINKPAQPQSPPPQDTTSWKYKPYKPYSPGTEGHDASQPSRYQDTSSPSKAGAATVNMVYRPYRRPSFKEPPQEEQRHSPSSLGHTSPRPQHESSVGSPGAQPCSEGMAPHHIYMAPTPQAPEHDQPSLSPRLGGAPFHGVSPATPPRPMENVSWPHPQGVVSPVPSQSPPASSPKPPADAYQHSLSPTFPGSGAGSPGHNYAHSPPPPPSSQSPSALNAGRRTPQPYSIAAPVPASSASSPRPEHQTSQSSLPASPQPSKFATLPDEPALPSSPPPAYADIAPSGSSTQPPADVKASIFPQAPSSFSAPQTPHGHQSPPPPTHPTSHRPSPPVSHASYGSATPQPLSGSSLHPPPPLPPRPSSSGGPARPVPGFSGQPVPAAYPAPPKTYYTPQHQPPPGGYSRPSTAGTSKLFGGSAKKWLDKTNKLVENKVGEILQNHPDPKYRPQPGQYGYHGGQSGYAGPASSGSYVTGQPYHGPPQTQAQAPQEHYPTQPQYAHPQGPPPPGPRP